jgi:hypothetical protein
MEPEDLDAILERRVPADLGTAHMEAPVDREVLGRPRRLQGEDEPDIVAEFAGMFLEDARSPLARPRTTRTNQGGVGAGRARSGGRGKRFQVKWFQPDKPSTCSSPRSKTTSPSVISPISVRGTSTFFASASRTGQGAQIRSS